MRESAQSAPPRQSASAPARVGRNDLCPCGSGKKFKKCHGAALEDEEEDDQPSA
jgi:preprotein translocase subunit SecA